MSANRPLVKMCRNLGEIMSKSLAEWVKDDVHKVKDEPVTWLSQYYFFRDPIRPTYSDSTRFFAPADGVILYQDFVRPADPLLPIKGATYSVREALREPEFDKPSLVIGIFMTFFDVHVNRIPFPGFLSYRSLDPIDTLNHPMLEVEKSLLEDLRIPTEGGQYLRHNQRVVNRIDAHQLGQQYYLVQIADYDVDSITPFELKQNQFRRQGERFSQIRYGSQVELIIPLSDRYEFAPTQRVGHHVEAGIDPLVTIREL